MNEETMMNGMDEAENLVAVWTGIKQKFVDAGWSAAAAEQMVIEVLKHT